MCKRRFPGASQSSGSYTFNPSFSASDFVPDSYCLAGTVEARLQKRRVGRSFCLPVPASSVVDERGSTAHLRPASLRPHLRRTHQPPLAPGLGQSIRFKTAVLMYKATRGTAPSNLRQVHGSCRRSARSTFPPFCSDQSSASAVRETVYRQRPGLPSRRTHHLEQPAGQRDISPVSVNLPSVFKNISVSCLVP